MGLPEWLTHELHTGVRSQIERLVFASGASPDVIDSTLDELADRLANREWTGSLADAVRGVESDDARAAVGALARRICRRRIADDLRRSLRREVLLHAREPRDTTAESTEEAISAHELLTFVIEALEQLSTEDRELIAAAVEEEVGLVKRETAMSSTERSQLTRARQRLAAAVRQRMDREP